MNRIRARSGRLSVALVLVALLAVAACGSGGAPEASADGIEKPDLVVGASALSGGLMTTFVAESEGLFAAQGLSVEVLPFQGSPAAMQGLIGGQADAIVLGFASVLNLHGTPQQPVVVTESNSTPSFVYYGKAGLDSWQAVAAAGGVVGVSSIGGMDYQLAQYMARKDGVDPKSLKFQAAGDTTARAQALLAGQLDAVASTAATAKRLEQEGMSEIGKIADYGLDRFPLEVYAVTQDLYDKSPNTVAALVRADRAARQWILEHSDEQVVDVLSKYYTISADDRPYHLAAMKEYREGLARDGYSEEAMRVVTQFAIDQGEITATDPTAVIGSFVPELRR
ncbi:ABC transporter substrate-binding protein [Pseudonocardia sulfidoxydans NBRC 16205]|uniref:ABC transporter substrate-binding protein n=1 Tax=Pseudonocardia sulfidoxydans NBRC 16205 TaxID=1223511 RepID=A0A511DEF6_9PSEU|nr:ABC transporter substrate-binding protein [Pseudonocardia sulfidoxydans]GEL23162.1 ABC transporter substrate-binding protein [Pseudonocardia sulfidoxydans NBRC 16205]